MLHGGSKAPEMRGILEQLMCKVDAGHQVIHGQEWQKITDRHVEASIHTVVVRPYVFPLLSSETRLATCKYLLRIRLCRLMN